MRIIKKGDPNRLEYLFQCSHCGCEFVEFKRECRTLETDPFLYNHCEMNCPACNTRVLSDTLYETPKGDKHA